MRFDSDEYLKAFRDRDQFPRIHRNIVNLVQETARGTRVLDLCCSTGLLAAQLRRNGFRAFGIEGSWRAIEAARDYGVNVPMYRMQVSRETLPEIPQKLVAFKTNVVVARRCFPEMFGKDRGLGNEFVAMLSNCGVEDLYLEGRVRTRRAVNPLDTIDKEVELASSHFNLHTILGNCAYLRRKEQT